MKKLRDFFTLQNLIRLYPIESIERRQSIEPIECRQSIEHNRTQDPNPIERNRILPRKQPFDCDSIAFDNRIAIIRSRSIDIVLGCMFFSFQKKFTHEEQRDKIHTSGKDDNL